MIEKIGGRKAAACLTGLIVVVGCFLYKGALPNELVQAVQYLVTTYLAGNVMTDVVANVAAVSSKKADIAASTPVVLPSYPYDDSLITQRMSSFERALQEQNTTLTQVVGFLQNNSAAPQANNSNIR